MPREIREIRAPRFEGEIFEKEKKGELPDGKNTNEDGKEESTRLSKAVT
jgi:hypothetical protein